MVRRQRGRLVVAGNGVGDRIGAIKRACLSAGRERGRSEQCAAKTQKVVISHVVGSPYGYELECLQSASILAPVSAAA